MGKHEIVCIVHDEHKVIVKVGTMGRVLPVQTVVDLINTGGENFYTNVGRRADVRALKHPKTGRWFLTTEPDGLDENNLDFLPQCG